MCIGAIAWHTPIGRTPRAFHTCRAVRVERAGRREVCTARRLQFRNTLAARFTRCDRAYGSQPSDTARCDGKARVTAHALPWLAPSSLLVDPDSGAGAATEALLWALRVSRRGAEAARRAAEAGATGAADGIREVDSDMVA